MLGILIPVLNDTLLIADVVPIRHSEAFLVLGIAVAIASTWFLGLFDRGTTIYQ